MDSNVFAKSFHVTQAIRSAYPGRSSSNELPIWLKHFTPCQVELLPRLLLLQQHITHHLLGVPHPTACQTHALSSHLPRLIRFRCHNLAIIRLMPLPTSVYSQVNTTINFYRLFHPRKQTRMKCMGRR